MMQDGPSNDGLWAVERFCLRAFLVSFGFVLFWFALLLATGDWAFGIHGAMLGIEEADMERFVYDARMMFYFLMGAFKLTAFLLFLIPWLVLRFSRK